MTGPFYRHALAVLQDISTEPCGSVEELKRLRNAIDMAIGEIESGRMIEMSEVERLKHAIRFGPGAFVIGEFVITKRSL